jgi:murein L,D-transpeptidase YafK
MKTTLLLTTCLFAAGGLMLKKEAAEKTITTTRTTSFLNASTAKKRFASMPQSPMYIVINKKKYELSVYDAQGWFATYPVVFGNPSLEDKKMEGDRNTPEGSFKIVQKNVHYKWDRYMGIDYPTKESLAKFSARKQRGEIPASAKPGGGIGIHGTWPGEDIVVDRFTNWTNGCISLKRADVEDLYSYLPIGTPVTIKK